MNAEAHVVSTLRDSGQELTPGRGGVPAHIRDIHRGTEPRCEHQACLVPLLASCAAFGILLSAQRRAP